MTSAGPGFVPALVDAPASPPLSAEAGRGAAPTRTLLRGLDVIEALSAADASGLGPSVLADSTRLDKATVSRLLRTLVEAGWVRQDAMTRRYRLTGKIVRLAGSVRTHLDLRTAAAPHLQALRQRLGETVHLGVMEEARVVYLDKLEAPHSIQLVSRVGQMMPLHSTSLGKAILAALPEAEREAILAGIDFAPRTERTIDNVADFREALALTQQRGFATDDRENEPLGACVAAAIMGADGRPLGAISVSGPHYRIRDHFADFGTQARAAAEAVALDLGAAFPGDMPARSGAEVPVP